MVLHQDSINRKQVSEWRTPSKALFSLQCVYLHIQKSFFQDSAGSLVDDDIVPLPLHIFTCHNPLATKPSCLLPSCPSRPAISWDDSISM